jgi:SAM-dependent methyltransferase
MTDLPNPDLLTRIPWTARTVLDVGCARGALGAAYRRINPAVRLLGIDKDPDAADAAALHYDDVVAGDVERDPLPFDLPDGLDCVVYGDVLEHLVEPFAVVRRHARALTPDGVMLICVPNVEHWSFAARLLRGDWEYEPDGLFDAGHLRWFSLETMRRELAAAGLFPCDVQPRVFEPDKHDAFVRALTPALQALGIDAANYARRAAPLQYVWRARARPRRPLTVGATMLRPVGGVSDVRVVYPMRGMATEPDVTAYIGRTETAGEADRDEPRIFVLHRPMLVGERGLDLIGSLLARGYLLVTEFDDHPDVFEDMRRQDQYAFAGVHAVQTSTPALAAILRGRGGEVAVFPNGARSLPEVRNFADPARLTLFFGALNRERDWQPHLPALNEIAAAAGERLRFSVVHDRALFDALQTPHKAFTPTCDHQTYLTLLGEAEISFMPLRDTAFNRAKSDLKFVEAGASRVVPLASPVVYAATIRDGDTGVLFASPEALRLRLARLLSHPGEARGVADRAREHVARERMLAYQIGPRLAWYRSLWARRAELTAALLERVPQLAAAQS